MIIVGVSTGDEPVGVEELRAFVESVRGGDGPPIWADIDLDKEDARDGYHRRQRDRREKE